MEQIIIDKIAGKSHTIIEPAIVEKKKNCVRSSNAVAKFATTIVGFLAASQGFGTAAARPVGGMNGLAVPLNRNDAGSTSKFSLTDDTVLPRVTPVRRKLLSNMQTWVVNKSDTDIVGTTSYNCFSYCSPKSQFVNRPISANSQDHDQYCQQSQTETTAEDPSLGRRGQAAGEGLGCSPSITLTLKYSTANNIGTFNLEPDESVIVSNVANSAGLNVYKAVYGDLSSTDGDALGQIYDN